MADKPHRKPGDAAGVAKWVAARMRSTRWLLAGLSAAFVIVGLSGAAWPALALAVAIAAATILLAPLDGTAQTGGRGERSAMAASGPHLGGAELAAAVPDPLLLFDTTGTILYGNTASREAFGSGLVGSNIELRFRAPEMRELVRQVNLPGVPSVSVDYAEKVPLERWFRVTATRAGDGEIFVLVFRDQSEIRRIDRMRADFIANASHELRTPLASIAGFIETLRGPARNDPAARDSFLQIMHAQTGRMARLIDDLLSLSRLEMKTTLGPGETVELTEVLRSVVDALAQLAAESGVTIEMELLPAPVEIAGNRDELIQVFENLVENACKYGRSGGRVVVSMVREPAGGIAVNVRDFGPGIPEEHIPRVTERFYRVDVDSSRGQKGTGLGLSIVKHILTRHNARLSIASVEGEGATFTAHFPTR